MEPQNTSSHHLLPSGFPTASFPAQFAGLNTDSSNVSSPLFMSTLQQLSGLSGSAAAGFLPPSTKLPLGNQFPTDLANVQWNPQQAAWLDPTKMAAMLPMYGVLQSAVVGETQLGSISVMEQSLKNQASLAAAAAVCTPTTLDALRFAQKSVDQPTNSITPDANENSSKTDIHGVPMSPARRANSRLQSTPAPASIASSPMTSSAGNVTPHSCNYSASTSHPASNEMMHVDSPIDHQHRNFLPNTNQFSPTLTAKNPMQSQSALYNYPSSSKNSLASDQVNSLQAEAFRVLARRNSKNSSSVQPSLSMDQNPLAFGSNRNSTSKEPVSDYDFSMLELADFEAFMGKEALNALESFPHANQHPSTSASLSKTRTVSDRQNPNKTSLSSISPRKSQHREEELAHVDKELDRLVSLAAKKDATTSFQPTPFDPFKYLKNTSTIASSTSKQAKLNPVNFTPPESPSRNSDDEGSVSSKLSTSLGVDTSRQDSSQHRSDRVLSRPSTSSSTPFSSLLPGSSATSTSMSQALNKKPVHPESLKAKQPMRPPISQTPSARIFSERRPSATSITRPAPSASVQPLLFIPKQQATSSKLPVYKQSTKVPVYKQKASSLLPTVSEKKIEEKPKADDAFSFTDDEEGDAQLLPPIAKAPIQNMITTQKANETLVKMAIETATKETIKNEPKKSLNVEVITSEEPATPTISKGHTKSTIAEQIRSRQKHSLELFFVQSESTDDTAAAISSTAKELQPMPFLIPNEKPAIIKKDPSPCPSKTSNEESTSLQDEAKFIPKLVIKLKRETDDIVEKHKKKKKRKHKDRDHEWEGSEHHKKKKKKKHKHNRKDSVSYEAHVMSENDEDYSRRRLSDASLSRKMHSLEHWQEHEERYNENEMHDDFASTSRNGNLEAFVNSRLSQFGPAHGDLPKGTFVVAKADIFKPDCSLWRVDNQNLLQKFPPVTDWVTSNPCYKNSSTYSGWCDQIADGYLTVGVKYHKQTRIETIVEPEIPISDLFPAITEEIPIQNGIGDDAIDEEPVQDTIQMTKDVLRSHIKTFVNALLQHTISMSFLQSVKHGNDWNYLCALNEVEKMNVSGKQKVKEKVKWIERFANEIEKYVEFTTFEVDCPDELCQACGEKKVTKVGQFFHLLNYNYETLEIIGDKENGAGSPLQAIEFLICSTCAHLAFTSHKLHHMRFIVFKRCEEKMECLSLEKPDLTPDALVHLCMSKRTWLNQIVNEYVEIWKRVQLNDL